MAADPHKRLMFGLMLSSELDYVHALENISISLSIWTSKQNKTKQEREKISVSTDFIGVGL